MVHFDEKMDETEAERVVEMTQYMIDTAAKHLHGLRTQCRPTDEISQREIRETENKLIRLIGKQLMAKAKLNKVPSKLQKYPDVEQWLKIVDINQAGIDGLMERGFTVEGLLEMSEDEVSCLLTRYHIPEEDIKRLTAALNNLNTWTDLLMQGDAKSDMDLHWSSYKSASSSPYGGNSPKFGHHQRPSTSSLPPDTYLNAMSPQSPASPPTPPQSTPASPLPCPSPMGGHRRLTPPATPSLVKPRQGGKFPTTPPPQKKNKLYPESFHPLIKSKSHESQLSNKINQDIDIAKILMKLSPANHLTTSGSHEAIYPRKYSTDGSEFYTGSGHTSPLVASPKHIRGKSSMDGDLELHPNKKNQLMPPMSPNSPSLLGSGNMKHSISHSLVRSLKLTACHWCQKQVILGVKCRHCKMRFHRDCASKAAPACGLPSEYVDFYLKRIQNGSPGIGRRGVEHTMSFPGGDGATQSFPDSSSNTSSCTSSTASSPAHFPPSPSIHISKFQFPDTTQLESSSSTIDYIGTFSSLNSSSQRSESIDVVNTNTSNDSDKSDKTLVDTGSSSEKGALLDRVDSQESTEEGLSQSWHRVNSISVALKEWDIPYEELQFIELLGTGRFGNVFKGTWHGDVAIKVLNMDPNAEHQAHQLQAFKLEVSMLRKTRHVNLVLFMGACMKPPHLAIVTSLCKNHTLYTHIHLRNEKFQLNRAVIIASQVLQGMGYLHAKDIIHKDLKTKNIFLEPGKVVLTDFGLFNVTKLCHGKRKGDWLSIPPGWLCYLAPEVMRRLRAGNQYDMDLPFSKASDVYAFGTVWYELLAGEWPFKNQPPECIIWQVGKGMKQSLGNLHQSKDIKDVLMSCWSYSVSRRPDFGSLLKTLEKIPKKRGLERCPSHPIQLSRSAESVF